MRLVFLGSDFWGLYFLRRLVERREVVGIISTPGSLGLMREGRKRDIPCYPILNRKDRGYRVWLKTLIPT